MAFDFGEEKKKREKGKERRAESKEHRARGIGHGAEGSDCGFRIFDFGSGTAKSMEQMGIAKAEILAAIFMTPRRPIG